nr:MAG TPA: hypothetical protein [Caudoviricetes sp.]
MGSSSPIKKRPTTDKFDLAVRKSAGRELKPKNDTTRGKVFTGPEARKAQDKQSKKHYKNPMNTTSSSRYS